MRAEMPTNLPEITEMLATWSVLAADNILFVVAVVIVTWVLSSIINSFKVLALKKREKNTTNELEQLKEQLTSSQQQAQQNQDKAAESALSLEKSQLEAKQFKEQLAERHQTVITAIKAVAEKFDLSEQLVSGESDIKAEVIWQQQDNIVMQLTDKLERIQTENTSLQVKHEQEIIALSEKDNAIQGLESSLTAQTEQLTQLENTLHTQNTEFQAQQLQSQQVLTDILEKHQLESSRLMAEFQQQVMDNETLRHEREEIQLTENIKAATLIEEALTLKEAAADITPAPVEIVAEKKDDVVTIDNKAMEAEETIPPVVEIKAEPEQEVVLVAEPVIEPEPKVIEQPSVGVVIEEPSEVAAEPEKSKSRFGGVTKMFAKADKATEIETTNIENEQQTSEVVEKKGSGKLKGFFGKNKATDTQPEVIAEPSIKKEKKSKLKGFFNKKPTAAASQEVTIEPVVELQASIEEAEPKQKKPSKLKGFFAKKQPEIEVAIEQPVIEPIVTETAIAEPVIENNDDEPEEVIYSPTASDYSNPKLSGMFKKMLGKNKK